MFLRPLLFVLSPAAGLAVASGLVTLARFGVYRHVPTGEAPDDGFAYRRCRETALAVEGDGAGESDGGNHSGQTEDGPTGPDDARGDPA